MKRKRFTEEQIISVLKDSGSGAKADDIEHKAPTVSGQTVGFPRKDFSAST